MSRAKNAAVTLVVIALPVVAGASPGQTPAGTAGSRSSGNIRGQVVAADTSRPIRRARVTLGGSPLSAARIVTTNVEGRFEFRGLPPGSYTLSASRNGYLHVTYGQRRPDDLGRPLELEDGENLERVDFLLPRMSVISGRVTDDGGEPLEHASVTALRLQHGDAGRELKVGGVATTDATGAFRLLGLIPGEYWMVGATSETWSDERDGRSELVSYEPTYYPGVAAIEQAQLVRVGLGQELPGVDIELRRGRTAEVSGRAVSSRGMPLSGRTVYLSQQFVTASNGTSGGMMKMAASGSIAPDGSFRLRNVPAGSYLLQVTVPSSADGPAEAASQPMIASGADVDGILIVTSSGGRIQGVVEGDTDPVDAIPARRVRLTCRPLSDNLIPLAPEASSGQVNRDRSFTLTGVFEPCVVRSTTLPDGWAVKAVYLSDRDVTDLPIDPRGGDDVRVRVVLTAQMPALGGTATTERNTRATDYVVIAFAEQRAAWGPGSRFVRAARPDQNGRFNLQGLPAANYWVVALDDIEAGRWRDAPVLESLLSLATYVTLRDGDRKDIELKVRALP